MTRLRVAVVGGGRNAEHEVSLASAAAIVAALDPDRYRPVPLTIGRDGCWYGPTAHRASAPIGFPAALDLLQRVDVVIPAVHGRHGEDGSLAALCELVGVPYAGSGVAAGAVGLDKHATKLLAAAAGVATAPGEVLERTTAESRLRSFDGGPVVVKPVSAGSSVGVSAAATAQEFASALTTAFAVDERVLIEPYVSAREIDVAVLRRADGQVIIPPPLEIVVDGVFDYETKYGGEARFIVPAPLENGEQAALERAALLTYDAIGCAGIARLDFFVTPDGVLLNEINTTPGFTPHSQVPRMFAAAGVGYPALVDLVITEALASHPAVSNAGRR